MRTVRRRQRGLLPGLSGAVVAAVAAATLVALPSSGASGGGSPDVVDVGPAGTTSRLAGASRSAVISYTTRTVRGRRGTATGLMLIPRGERPDGGWPVVVYGHMTTGAADRCAPTNGTPNDTEKQKMQQGDDTTRALLRAGVAVLRPDYEGLGAPGPHPYLHGPSLGRAMVDMLTAVNRRWPALLGDRWVVSGHSEGAVAALHAADRRRPQVRDMTLVGISAFTPVTRLELLVQLLQVEPVPGPFVGELVGLAALLLKGHSATDPAFRRLLMNGGLSARARALWPHLEDRCLADLSRTDSWGGLAPAQVLGPRGEEASRDLRRWLARHDVRHLHLADGVPLRVDLGLLDAVALAPFTEQLIQTYRSRGTSVTVGRWPSGHSPTNSDGYATPDAVSWMVARLRG
ncbi:lipase family protein [Nocardioides sp. R-C-SC26]|uniref:lipase family protein n=1 Tax=Nocardioides sp. R-C-SC26 TaxID=2870414 RepID=UPI001E5895DB|nr:lipase family protein [Nocardioides sp. R-C-SC26]